MFPIAELQELHVELTERCNARCPMCGRFDTAGNEISYLTGAGLTLDLLRQYLPKPLLAQLRSLRLCGNFGDPAAARDALPICEWLRSTSANLALHLHSNGSLRDAGWWFDLGRLFRGTRDAVHFAIDGLEDTNAVYRRGTSFARIMENADAFIRGGGRAHWVFLAFAHNEHQLQEAERTAKMMGFSRFAVKATKRFLDNKTLAVRPAVPIPAENGPRHGKPEPCTMLEPPRSPELQNRGLVRLRRHGSDSGSMQILQQTAIECRAVERRGAYLSATGHLFPCCWIGANVPSASSEAQRGSIREHLEPYGGLDQLSLAYRSIEEIFVGPIFNEAIPRGWHQGDGRLTVCARTCGVDLRTFDDQFLST